MFKSAAFFILSISFLGVGTVHADQPKKRKAPIAFMASLGDSLTAATLADTTIIESETHKKPIWSTLGVFQDFFLGVGVNNSYYSWSSGRDIRSHYILLQSWMKKHEKGVGLAVKNFAVPGVASVGLELQAERVVAEMKKKKYKYLKYVTVTIGGNDICSFSVDGSGTTPPEDFKTNVRKMFRVFGEMEQEEPISIFVSSIPNASRLGEQQFLDLDIGKGNTCAHFRNVHNTCANLLVFENEEGYLKSVQVVIDQNTMLKELTEEAAKEYPNLRTHFSEVFFNYKITPDILGYDCFHPNKKGHSILSELTFADQPFFRP